MEDLLKYIAVGLLSIVGWFLRDMLRKTERQMRRNRRMIDWQTAQINRLMHKAGMDLHEPPQLKEDEE